MRTISTFGRGAALAVLIFTTTLAVAQPVVIDGQYDSAEWSGAQSHSITVGLPGGGTTSGTIYVKNDSSNIYFCVRFQQSSFWASETVSVIFDSNADASMSGGDDAIGVWMNGSCTQNKQFNDTHYFTGSPCPSGVICNRFDTSNSGATNGNGVADNDGSYTTYEMWHPLNSSDSSANDIAFSVGDDLGFIVMVRLQDVNSTIADTYHPGPNLVNFQTYSID